MKEIVFKVETISDLHRIAGFENPKHPLISIIDYSKVKVANAPETGSFVCSFYSISFKKYCSFVYGRQAFDHQEGTLHCTAPEQIIAFDRKKEIGSTEGWGLYFHPELIRNTSLGKKIQEYAFFNYQENESLHLSEHEKHTLLGILRQMENEYNTNIDHYSHELIVSNIELLLNYCKRFYGTQFITRTNQNKDTLADFERYLLEYIRTDKLKTQGIPSVKHCAESMNLSANYFGDLLKNETGRNAQEHIHYFVLEQAKNLLAGPENRINEIAYNLGFEYPQNFSKLFKKKIGLSPTDFRTDLLSKKMPSN